MVGEGGVTVLKHETFLLLAATVFPCYVHGIGVGREQSLQAVCLQLHVQHVVFAEHVFDGDGLALASYCCESGGGVGRL